MAYSSLEIHSLCQYQYKWKAKFERDENSKKLLNTCTYTPILLQAVKEKRNLHFLDFIKSQGKFNIQGALPLWEMEEPPPGLAPPSPRSAVQSLRWAGLDNNHVGELLSLNGWSTQGQICIKGASQDNGTAYLPLGHLDQPLILRASVDTKQSY